ncbi:MAG: DNA repair protein RecO [Fidelibacterota bacterium]|nr:MAG: DNA repair protein RecO [Candidatus Neomarinimicrobiota bacterium]
MESKPAEELAVVSMPIQLSSDAIVLRSINYSDTSLIVRLFTEQFGKVSVIAKGARRPKRSVAGLLQPPNHITVWYQHKEGRDIQTLIKSEFVERYSGLTADLARSTAALVAVEMLDRAVHDSDPHSMVFRLITSTLRQLDQIAVDAPVLLHFYQLHLAKQLGFGPRLSSCGQCGRALDEASLDMITGNLLCARCRIAQGIRLGRSSLEYLRDLDHTHISRLSELQADDNAVKETGNFLLNHLFFHVDGMSNLKSIKFWRQVTT